MSDDSTLYLSSDVKESDILDTEPVCPIADCSDGEVGHATTTASLVDDMSQHLPTATTAAATTSDGASVIEPAVFTHIPLPWGCRKERTCLDDVDVQVNSGEYVMRALFAEFTAQSKRKAEAVMLEPLERPLSKSLQRGEDAQFDQLLTVFGSVAEFCLPSLLRALFAWYDRQGLDVTSSDPHASVRSDKSRQDPPPDRQEWENREDRRDLAIEFVFCLVLVEVLRQLHLHPGHEDLVRHLENMAFRHFKYRESSTAGPNAVNVNLISDLYAEVVGVLAQSRFQPIRARFMRELRELSAKESCQHTSQGIIALLMGMKFFRVKMVPIEEFEASFQFLQELSQYFLEVKDKDIKHALAGLFVEILVPVAACVKNEVNVPCLKSFVEMLYTHTLDMCTKGKHRLAIFPLVTCLLCVSQKQFFLSNWHYFLAMCLSNLKNKDTKMSRVALESLYRLLWVYMIRIKCESNSATQSRLQSIVNSLFPKGSKNVVPRETPLNIFVKIIQFIAQERLDFAMRDIVFDLLSVGRPIKIVTTPERMSIGLRAFLVVADSLQQKEGQPPMPRTMAVLPSGSTLRVKKTFLNTVLSDDTARGIGVASYYLHVRRVFGDILRALDAQLGSPLLMTSTQNVNKEPDELITGERKPKIDLFRTCVAAIPRLLPDGMDRQQLVELLTRLTVHMDEELRVLSFQSLQNIVLNLAEWRHDVVVALVSFVSRNVADTCQQQLLDNALRMLLQLMTTWRSSVSCGSHTKLRSWSTGASLHPDPASVLHLVEGFVLVTLCHYRLSTRRLCVHILKETNLLFRSLDCLADSQSTAIEVLDSACIQAVERCHSVLPPGEKAALLAASGVDLQWIAERNSAVWTAGVYDDGARSTSLPYLGGADAWRVCLTVFLERSFLPSRCTCSVAHAWPIVHQRTQALLALLEPPPASENRASLLRPTTASKRPTDQRDSRLSLWRNYALFAYRVMPSALTSPVVRCVSPDSAPASLSTIPVDTGSSGTGGSLLSVSGVLGGGTGSEPIRAGDPASLHRLMVPLLRCDTCHELRDGVTEAFGLINHAALGDLLLELVAYIREAIDRKQENVRRRRRRDALRLQLITVFETIAEQGVFGLCPSMIDSDTQSLYPMFVDYIDGARLYLETESDKDATTSVQAIKLKFCWFVRKLIHNFSLESRATLLSNELRGSLCQLLASWSGALGAPFRSGSPTLSGQQRQQTADWTDQLSELEVAAVHACWSLICCGPLFDPAALHEEGSVYTGLDLLLAAPPAKLQLLARESLVLLLEFNSEASALLDWVVERCHTGDVTVADTCFHAIATVFGAKDYPCDHYTAIINVTLLNTGCARADVHETAFQLLLVLEQRFFGHGHHVLPGDGEWESGSRHSMLDSRLATGFSRSQLYLSQQLAQLHPELTMPLFSEITCRLQTARPDARQLMLQYLLPWLHNMQLVDPHVPVPGAYSPNRADSWGSAEATEMVVNNLLYITAEVGDQHPHALEQLWSTLCSCWPNNLKIILRYLFIVCGMTNGDLVKYGRRVVVYLARARSEQLVQEMIRELRTVESTSYLVERTETPPFFRLTALRKASSHSVCRDDTLSMATEKGTIHTKRHSGEQNVVEFAGGVGSSASSSARSRRCRKERGSVTAAAAASLGVERSASATAVVDNFTLLRVQSEGRTSVSPPPVKVDTPQPRPLPMPEYGGYFAPLYRYLPPCSQPLGSYHRCNLALMLLQDVLLDGGHTSTPLWPLHVPLLLHIAFLALDHSRSVVVEAGRRVLLALLVVLARHPGHTAVARALVSCRIELLEYGVVVPPVLTHRLSVDTVCASGGGVGASSSAGLETAKFTRATTDDPAPKSSIEQRCLSLIDFLASRRQQPLWSHEDVTARDWNMASVQQLANLLHLMVDVFAESLSRSRVRERWAQLALHVALSCSSRHLAGRSLQIFRSLRVPINSRMFSDVLSRLVETVGEQGEDMQGYVTEIMLTLGAAVDCIDSEFRPIDFGKELFNSTPNLINREQCRKMLVTGSVGPTCGSHLAGHLRASGMSASSRRREEELEPCVLADSHEEQESTPPSPGSLSRSHSASNLKGVQVVVEPDAEKCKLTVLSQLFWLSVSLLESDFEHEYLLAMRLLEKLLAKLSLERRECREKLEKIQQQLRWPTYPGLHALLLKGCTHVATYDLAIDLISRLTPFLQISVVDPSLSLGFPMNVVALLPHMVHYYEDDDDFCLRSAENIALACMERDSKLENLATVMTLYSRRTFNRESMQWTKCVVKYLTDAYSQISVNLMVFLVDVLEKGPAFLQLPILNVLGCLLHYMEPCTSNTSLVNADLLQAMSRCVQQVGSHWREALRILKLAVTQSSALSLAPSAGAASEGRMLTSFTSDASLEPLLSVKKELPGRTMEFSFDVSQVPIIGRRLPGSAMPSSDADSTSSSAGSGANDNNSDGDTEEDSGCATLRRSATAPTATADAASQQSCWKKPWQSQSRTRDRLVRLLMSCGTRVGLPKSPSVIFSQNSDLMERHSSVASSTEEMSVGGAGATVNASAESLDDHEAQQFSVIRVFDFLEYELASQDGESLDNFNWGVRRRTLSDTAADTLTVVDTESSAVIGDSRSADHSAACSRVQLDEEPPHGADESSDDDGGSVSPLDMTVTGHEGSRTGELNRYHQSPAAVDDRSLDRRLSSSSESSIPSSELAVATCSSPAGLPSQSVARSLQAETTGGHTPPASLLELSSSPSMMVAGRHSSDLEEQWFRQLAQLTDSQPDGDSDHLETMIASSYLLFCRLLADIQRSFVLTVDECIQLVPASPPPIAESASAFCHQLLSVCDLLRCMRLPLVYINAAAVSALSTGSPLRFALLELQQHVLTYQERRELVARCVDASRCTLSLDDTTGEGASAGGPLVDHWCLQLLHTLHRLHFQLLLLFDGLVKTLSVLAARPSGLVLDLSSEVNQLRHLLNESGAAQSEATAGASGADAEEASGISRLLTEGRCAEALAVFQRVRHQLPTELLCEGDDVDSLLAVYCWLRSQQDQRPLVALSRTTQLDTACSLLQHTNVTLVTHLRHMERVARAQPWRQRQVLSDPQSDPHSADC